MENTLDVTDSDEFYPDLFLKTILAGTPYISGLVTANNEIENRKFKQKIAKVANEINDSVNKNAIELASLISKKEILIEVIGAIANTDEIYKHNKLIRIACSYLCQDINNLEVVLYRHFISIVGKFEKIHFAILNIFKGNPILKFEIIISHLELNTDQILESEILWLIFNDLENCILVHRLHSNNTEAARLLGIENDILHSYRNSKFKLSKVGEYFLKILEHEIQS